MPSIKADDGVSLYYEEAGSGTAIVFVHEFAGDYRSWEPQMRHFARRYRCITYSARGYLPSDVPASPDQYSQERVRDDIRCVMDALKIERAHIVGCSMGAFAALHFGMEYAAKGQESKLSNQGNPGNPGNPGKAARALSLTLIGCGSGAHPAAYAKFQSESVIRAAAIRKEGMGKLAATYGHGAARIQFLNKDPRGFAEYAKQLAEHSAEGSANTMEGYQGRRPCLYDLTDRMAAIDVPVLVMSGDEDEPCLEPSLLIKRVVPKAGLVILPQAGHAINLEEPVRVNAMIDEFFHQVEAGRWGARDVRAEPESIWGPGGKKPVAA